MVSALSPSSREIHAVEIEMNGTRVGDSLLKGGLKSEGEVRLGQSFPSPMAVTRGVMGLSEYLDGFSLPRDRIG